MPLRDVDSKLNSIPLVVSDCYPTVSWIGPHGIVRIRWAVSELRWFTSCLICEEEYTQDEVISGGLPGYMPIDA